jgi:hypothetical protein
MLEVTTKGPEESWLSPLLKYDERFKTASNPNIL